MSGHIDVDFKVLPLGKEPMSKKLQKNKSAAALTRKENKKLDIDNKQMEWRLHQLKVTMEKEKEDRGKQGYFWQSSKTEAMESHSRNVLGKTVKTKNSKSKGKTKSSQAAQNMPAKVTVLKDQPLDLPKRDRPSKKLIKKLYEEDPQINEMEMMKSVADTTAQESPNNEAWISIAPDRLSDDIMEVQSDAKGNLPISSLQAVEPAAIGLYFIKWGRKRILPAVDQHIIRPKQGWGVETYYPYVPNNTQPAQTKGPVVNPPNFALPDEFKKKQRKKKTEIVHELPDNSLLKGHFDEDESAQSFQQALQEWRGKKDSTPVNKVGKRTEEGTTTPTVEMSVHAVQSDPVSIDIKFSETSSLSYMERLLLKKHRTSDVPPLPVHRSSSVNYNENFEDEEFKLTEEEMEDRERIRQLFTPRPSSRYSNDMNSNEKHSCTVTEVTTDEMGDLTDNEESPFIVEYVSDDQDDDSTPQQNVTDAVDIELESVTTGRVSQTSSSRSVDVATPRLTSYPPRVSSPPPTPHQVDTPSMQYPDYNRQPTSSIKSPTPSYAASSLNHPELKLSVTPEPARSIQSNRTFIKSPTPPTSAHKKGAIGRNVRSSKSEDQQRGDAESTTGDRSSLVSAVSRLPINPDAHYNNSLADFFASSNNKGDTVITPTLDSVRIDREIIEASSPNQLLMCNQDRSSWLPYNSVAFDNDEDDGVDQSIDASRFVRSQVIDDDETVECFSPSKDRVSNMDDERYQQEEDDAHTLDNLEWEIASRTGNITEDGRISRLIDDWSEDNEDQELGIINDNWAGSGLSTPEIDHLSLDDNDSPPQWRYQDFNDFEQIENYMINDVTHQDEEYQRRSFSQ